MEKVSKLALITTSRWHSGSPGNLVACTRLQRGNTPGSKGSWMPFVRLATALGVGLRVVGAVVPTIIDFSFLSLAPPLVSTLDL